MRSAPEPSVDDRCSERALPATLALCFFLVAPSASWKPAHAAPPAAAAALVAEPETAAAEPEYRGRPLAEVIRTLQGTGLDIVFTTELVHPDMEVVAEPRAEDPRAVLEEILEPHGLEVREGPGGVLVVARARRHTTSASTDEEAPDGEPGPREMGLSEEILVRPSRLSLLHDQPDAPFAFSRDEIGALPHLGGDVLRPMALLPGTAANDVTARFSVHGGRRDEVKIVLDGQELYDAFHLADYDSALSIVPALSLASASLSTGAFPASQGDRMSGVLDLRTPDPPAGRHVTLGLSVLDALASASGSFGSARSEPTIRGEKTTHGPPGSAGDAPRGRWLITARRGSLDLAGEAIGDENPAFWDVLAKTELDTPVGRWSAHLLTAADELEIDRTEEESFERLENDYHRTYGWLTHRAAPSDRLLVETVASWAEIRRDRSSATSEEEASFELRDRRELEVLGLSQSWSLERRGGHSLQWGWEARRYDASFDYLKDLRPEFVILSPEAPHPEPRTRFDDRLRGEHYGVWASDRFTVFDRLTAELGARYDHHTATDDDLLSPRVNLAWRLGARSVLRAAWGRFYQSQRPYELEVEDGETALRGAELSEHWVLGYEALLGAAGAVGGSTGSGGSDPLGPVGLNALRVELFRREVDNPRPRYENLLEPLNFFQEIEPDRVRIAPRRSTAEGIEVLVRGRPCSRSGCRFGWWVAYSYSRAEDRLDGRTVPRSLDQRHAVTVDLDVRLPRDWRLNLAWRYHSGWPTTPVEARLVAGPDDADEPELVPVFGPLYGERLPAYHRLDVRASRRWELGWGTLTFFVDVQNLYNRRNLAGFDVSVDEEAGVVELEEEHWPGLFPSFGFVWEW